MNGRSVILGLSLAALSASAPSFAQSAEGEATAQPDQNAPTVSENCPEPADTQIGAIICSDPNLVASAASLEGVWKTWEAGINGERISYLRNEQEDWLAARDECLTSSDPNNCLRTKYEERTQLLTRSRIFQTNVDVNGKPFLQLAEMTPLSFRSLQVEKTLADKTSFASEIERLRSNLSIASSEVCSLCTHERTMRLRLGFENNALLFVNQSEIEKIDNGDEVFRYRVSVFDKSSGQDVGIAGLFEPSALPFAKQALIDGILAELNALNLAVKGNENGQETYYWDGIDDSLKSATDAQWNQMGFFPVVEGGVITGFQYLADAYEFAPYGSSTYFSKFIIDAAPLRAFLKPQFASSFR